MRDAPPGGRGPIPPRRRQPHPRTRQKFSNSAGFSTLRSVMPGSNSPNPEPPVPTPEPRLAARPILAPS